MKNAKTVGRGKKEKGFEFAFLRHLLASRARSNHAAKETKNKIRFISEYYVTIISRNPTSEKKHFSSGFKFKYR